MSCALPLERLTCAPSKQRGKKVGRFVVGAGRGALSPRQGHAACVDVGPTGKDSEESAGGGAGSQRVGVGQPEGDCGVEGEERAGQQRRAAGEVARAGWCKAWDDGGAESGAVAEFDWKWRGDRASFERIIDGGACLGGKCSSSGGFGGTRREWIVRCVAIGDFGACVRKRNGRIVGKRIRCIGACRNGRVSGKRFSTSVDRRKCWRSDDDCGAYAGRKRNRDSGDDPITARDAE